MPPTLPEARTFPEAGELLARALAPRRVELLEAMGRVLDSGRFLLGEECRALEQELGERLAGREVIGVSSGTDALAVALAAFGAGPGSTVVTPALTASAGGAAIRQIGATPRYADVEPARLTLDPEAARAALAAAGPRPAAVVAVHLHGQPADVRALRAVADEYDVPLVEDCAQAFGAAVDGVPCGCWGDAAAFSFYPTKPLGALGDAGAIVTADAATAERVRAMREYGWTTERQRSEGWGINARLDELQAACLRVLLRDVPASIARRAALAAALDDRLRSTALRTPPRLPQAPSVHCHYVVRSERRDALRAALAARAIPTAVHPPLGLHEQPGYPPGDAARLPETQRALREMLSLPFHPSLTDDEAGALAAAVTEAAAGP